MNTTPTDSSSTGHQPAYARVDCPSCVAYLSVFRRVLLPIVGRRVQASGEFPGRVVERIAAGAHRRGHVVGLVDKAVSG